MANNFDKQNASKGSRDGDPLDNFNHFLDSLGVAGGAAAAGFAIGFGIAWLSARRLGARFDWALLWLLPLLAAIALVKLGAQEGFAAIAAIAASAGLFAGHLGGGIVLHFQDLRAGDDRAHEARERLAPHHLLLRRVSRRRIAAGIDDELAIGVTKHGGVAAIKRGGSSGSHSLILGATGAGKSTLLGVLAAEYARRGHAVILVEGKNDAGLEAQARAAAAAVGRPFILVSPDGPTVWDPFANGGIDETVARLLACEPYVEAHYRSQAVRFLRWVIRAMVSAGTRLTHPNILGLCAPDRLAAHAAKHADRQVASEVEKFVKGMTAQERSDVAGLRSRLAVLAESEYGRRWLDPDSGAGPVLDLSEAIRQRAIVYFRLDAERLGVVAEKVGASIAIELGAIASELQGRAMPTFIGVDEAGAIESDQIDRLFARGRAAGFSVAVATHTLADLRAAGDELEDRVKATVDSVLCLRSGPDDADAIARMAGQVGDWQSTNRTRGALGVPDVVGTRTRGYRLRMHPSVLQHLSWGECAVVRLDRSDGGRVVLARVLPSWMRGLDRNGKEER